MPDLIAHLASLAFLIQVLRITVPYLMAALGGCLSERSGVINIALEGNLLVGAFTAAVAAYLTDSVAVAVAAGFAGGLATGALLALCTVRFAADQILCGVAINLLAYGLTRYLLKPLFGSTANSAETVGFTGSVLANPVLWLAMVLTAGVALLLSHTPWGLRLRGAGEHPWAVAAAGVSVAAIRWQALLWAGGLGGLGGAWLSLGNHSFVAEMSAGRGYIALAAVIMGGWRPLPVAAACLLFGLAEALGFQLQASRVGLPSELVGALPYLLAILVLVGFVGGSRAPAALGRPLDRD